MPRESDERPAPAIDEAGALERYRKNWEAFVLSGAGLPIAHRLHIGTTQKRFRRAQRNVWLREAARRLSPVASPAKSLAEELARFMRAEYKRWREDRGPPAAVRGKPLDELDRQTAVRVCLFNALQLGPVPEDARQLQNVITDVGK